MCKQIEEFKTLISDNIETISNIGIVMHETPDPDCIASALGLCKLITSWNPDAKCTFLYSGEISHPQNKTMVNVLNIILTDIGELENVPEAFDAFVVVDTIPERCFGKEAKDYNCILTIDHHRVESKKSKITDIRPVGSTSSIVWEYLQKSGIEFSDKDDNDAIVATALLIGIKTDTSDLVSENVTDLDFKASQNLMSFVNRRYLSAIIDYPIPPYHFQLRSQLDQEDNIRSEAGVFVGGIGYLSPTKRDALPTMAEERARVEGIETAFVFGIVGEYIHVSVRSVGVSVDVNALCQKIFGKQYAGGKMGSGAAKIPLGFLSININAPEEVKCKLWNAVKALVMDKIFHVMKGNE